MPIAKLDDLVINKIAAGEVLQRPANAIKELLENSKDAEATSISISVSQGGLDSLTVTDNGIGIVPEDFPLLCERFATSKLKSFSDLSRISTFGFRGEALASISHVSQRLTVTSKRKGSSVAWKGHWIDGKLAPSPGTNSCKPVPCAGNQGTVLQVERMFYNLPTRRKAFHPDEEYARILQTCQRYALLWNDLAISCGRMESKTPDLVLLPTFCPKERISRLWGNSLGNSLLDLCVEEEKEQKFKFTALVSSLTWLEGKKFNFILFVNNRLVECPRLKKAISALYDGYLMKKSHPFVFGKLELPSETLDVNVHPTKNEVLIANEEEITLRIVKAMELLFKQNSQSKNFTVPLLMIKMDNSKEVTVGKETTKVASGPAFVRTDCRENSLEHVLSSQESILSSPQKRTKSEDEFESITLIKKSKAFMFSSNSLGYFDDCVFVGSVANSVGKHAILFQKGSTLNYLSRCDFLLYESFYQTILLNFAVPTPSPSGDEACISVANLNSIHQLESDAIGMLQDYFSITIKQGEDGSICIPSLIPNYHHHPPPPKEDIENAINNLIVEVVNCIDWNDEQKSFASIIHAIATFWTGRVQEEHLKFIFDGLWKQLKFSEEWMVAGSGMVTTVTDLPSLYKVFERC